MATTVGSHSISTFATPVNGGPLDANVVRGNDNTIKTAYVNHDADPGIHVQSSTLAARPAAGTAGRKWITEDSGVYTLWFDDGTNWHPVSSENINLTVLATENLVKGDVVKVVGWNNGQDLPEVAKVASASDVAFAIMTAAVTNGAMGYATNTGIIQDVNTNSFSAGTILYPNSSGGFTSTKPTSGNYQVVAYVLRQNTNNGVLFVEFSAPRIVERSDNTASTIVLRDASGNFSAGTITAGALTASGAVSAGSVTSTGLVTFASLKGTGATTVTNILDEDNMASDSATALATQQSIKAYVDAKVATVDTLAEVLANGNTTGANNIIVTAGQKITTDTIDETTSGSGVTIDSVLLKDDVVNATDIETGTISANNGALAITIANTTGALTLASALADSNLATISTAGKVANSATTATSANTASAIVARDASGNFSAGTITATLSGAAPAGSLSGTTLASNVVSSSLTSLGTLTSLTVNGDITASTNQLKLAASTGNLGIGTATPTYKLDVVGSANVSSGNTYKVNGTDVLSATTLGSGVTASSLTSVGTLTSLTVSGDLTVDTSTLKVDSTNNRVGIGTATPGYALDVVGGSATALRISGNSASTNNTAMRFYGVNAAADLWAIGNAVSTNDATRNFDIYDLVAGANRLRIDASGNLAVDTNTLYVDAANNRVGVGTASPGNTLSVSGVAGVSGVSGGGATVPSTAHVSSSTLRLGLRGSVMTSDDAGLTTVGTYLCNNVFFKNASGNPAYLTTNPASAILLTDNVTIFRRAASGTADTDITFTESARIDASGNLGLGVTPSAWGANYRALDIGLSSFWAQSVGSAGTFISTNAYFDGTNFKYKTAAAAAYYLQASDRSHIWYQAASGTAGNTISFTQAMTLDASGNLGVGPATTTPRATLGGIDIGSGDISLVLGGDNTASTRTNSTTKFSRIGSFHYTNAEEPFSIATCSSSSTANTLTLGGGTGLLNAATVITFNTAANTTTTDGTERARITSGGQFAMNADGSAAAPIITRVGDEDTGIFYPAANKIAFATSGTEQFRIGTNGTTYASTTTGIARSVKQSLGAVSSFTIDLAALMADMPISGNFRYGKIWVYYFISARATIEEWMFAATNAAGTIELVKRVSQGTAITGTATISSGNTTLTVDITPSATLAAGAYYVEMTVV